MLGGFRKNLLRICQKFQNITHNSMTNRESKLIFIRPSFDERIMVWRCPSVRCVIHNPCGQDIARTIWPRMLKLSVYTKYVKRKKPINFQGHISRSLCLYKEFWHLDPCGQDIARTIWPRMLKLSVYT